MTRTLRLMPLRRGAQSVILRLSVVPAALLSTMMGAGAASVEVKDGNVFFVQDGQQRQLTKSGKDADPVLSPDGKWVAFTRVGNPEFDEPQDCESGEKADELRRIRVDGSGEELLYRGATNTPATSRTRSTPITQFAGSATSSSLRTAVTSFSWRPNGRLRGAAPF